MRNPPLPLERPWYKTISQPVSILINTRLMGHLEFQVTQRKKNVKRASQPATRETNVGDLESGNPCRPRGPAEVLGGGGTWETPAAFRVYFSTQACPSLGRSHTERELWAAPTDSRTRIWGKLHAIVQVLFASSSSRSKGGFRPPERVPLLRGLLRGRVG